MHLQLLKDRKRSLLSRVGLAVSWGLLSACVNPAVATESCADACQLGAIAGTTHCRLWDSNSQSWVETIDDGAGQLHNRARVYLPWLRDRMMPAGGVMATVFADTGFESVSSYVASAIPRSGPAPISPLRRCDS